MQKKTSFILFIFICLFTALLFNASDAPKNMPSKTKVASPKEFMTRPIMTSFTERGNLKHVLVAEHWEYKPEIHLSKLATPQTTIFKMNALLSQNAPSTTSKQHATEAPITIQSDSAEFDDKSGTATYHHHVILSQETRQVTADKLTIQRNPSGHIAHIIATGKPAHFQIRLHPTKPLIIGHANTIKYFPEEEKIVLIENAELNQEGNIIRGPYLNYLLKSEVLSSEARPGGHTEVIIPNMKATRQISATTGNHL